MREPDETKGGVVLLVGARWLCPSCLVRGIERGCHCGTKTVDLESAEGAALAQRALGEGVFEPNRPSLRRWWSRRTGSARVEWVLAVVASLVTTAWIYLASKPGDGASLLVIPVFVLFVLLTRVTLYLGNLVMRLTLVMLLLVVCLFALVVEGVVLRRPDAKTATLILEVIPKLLELGPKKRFTSEPMTLRLPPPSFSGVLERAIGGAGDAEPLAIARFEGRAGDMVFADAVVPPFELCTPEGEIVRVEPGLGAVICSGDERAASADARAAIDLDAPRWLPTSVARAPISLSPGSPLRIAGGEWSEVDSASGAGEDFRHPPQIRLVRSAPGKALYLDVRKPRLIA